MHREMSGQRVGSVISTPPRSWQVRKRAACKSLELAVLSFSVLGCSLLRSGVLTAPIIIQHPNRRRIQVIELASPSARDERDDRGEHDESCQRDDDENHAHEARSVGKLRLSHDTSTTVSALAGMSTAAISGVITPVTASPAPITL